MEKNIITNRQLMIATAGFVYGIAPLRTPSGVTALAGRDSWISAILAGIAGLAFIWLYTTLGELYQGKTLIESILLVFGKVVGSIICIFYIFNALIIAAQVVWHVGDFLTTVYVPEGSFYTINLVFVAVAVIALLYGLEALARSNEIIFIIIFFLFIFSMVLVLTKIKPYNLLPIMENGVLPVIKGSIPIFGYAIWPLIFINMIYPANIQNIKKAKRSIYKGYLIGMFIVFVSIIMSVLVFGSNNTANLRFPLFWLTKEINVGTIFSRIEAVMLFIWLTSNYASALLFYYSCVKGLSQLLNIENHKRLIIPMGILIAAISEFLFRSVPQQIMWALQVWIPASAVLGFILPIIILVAALIRKKTEKQPHKNKKEALQ